MVSTAKRSNLNTIFSKKAMREVKIVTLSLALMLVASSAAFAQAAPAAKPDAAKQPAATAQKKGPPTLAEAEAFMKKAEARLEELSVQGNRAGWVQENFITDDTEIIGAQTQEKAIAVTTELALAARRFENLKMPPELKRKFMLLKLSLVAPAPNNDKDRAELTRIAASLDGDYGKGKYCKPQPAGAATGGGEKCLSLNDLSRILATSNNPDELLDAWVGWHKISVPMRQRYARFVELSNAGARELG